MEHEMLLQLLIILHVMLVHAENVTLFVEESNCGNSSDIGKIGLIHLLMPNGNVSILNICSFEFINTELEYETCFLLESKLDCHVNIEYRRFNSTIERNLTCDAPSLNEEHCGYYTTMSVVFLTSEIFTLQDSIAVKVYRKLHHEGSFLSDNPVLGIIIVVLLYIIVWFIAKKIRKMYREYKRPGGRTEILLPEAVPLQAYPGQTPVPGPQVLPLTPTFISGPGYHVSPTSNHVPGFSPGSQQPYNYYPNNTNQVYPQRGNQPNESNTGNQPQRNNAGNLQNYKYGNQPNSNHQSQNFATGNQAYATDNFLQEFSSENQHNGFSPHTGDNNNQMTSDHKHTLPPVAGHPQTGIGQPPSYNEATGFDSPWTNQNMVAHVEKGEHLSGSQ